MKLREMIQHLDIETYKNPLTEEQIPEVEKWLGMKLGPQLREYILEYCCLDSVEQCVEFWTIAPQTGADSEMVQETQRMRRQYRGMENYVMIEYEALDDVDAIVDHEDNVFWVDNSENSIIDAEMKLFDYLYLRLKYGDWVFMSDEERAEVEMSEEDRLRYAKA